MEDDRPFAEIRKSVHDVLRMLVLHRWAFFVPLCVVSCAAFILSLYYPRTYRATTSFERRNDPVMMNLPMSTGAASFKYFRNTMVRDLTSVECLEEVVDNLGLTRDDERDQDGNLTVQSRRRRASLARSLSGKLAVSTVSPSEHIDIIKVTYTGPDPTIGKALVDEVKRTYVRRTMTWIQEFLSTQRDYFAAEAEEALAEVNRVRREETRLRLENPHVDPTNPGAIALKLAQLEMERRELELRRREYEAEHSALLQLLAAAEPGASPDADDANKGGSIAHQDFLSPQALELAARVREIDRKIDELKSTRGMTDLHPSIQELLANRRSVEDALQEQRERDRHIVIPNGSLDAADVRAAAAANAVADPARAERARLLVQIAAQKAKLRDVEISLETNELAMEELRQAKREVFQKQEEFAEVMGRVAQARQKYGQLRATLASIEPAINAVDQNRLLQFSEGQPARGSHIPVSPKSTTVVLLALLAGAVTGALFVVLAEVFDNVYRSSGQVARGLGLPMLESVDEIVTAQDRRRIFVRKAVATPAVVVCLIGLTGLAGSMAYLSIERPWAYQKVRKIPQAALQWFTEEPVRDED